MQYLKLNWFEQYTKPRYLCNMTQPILNSVPYPLQLDVADITTMIKGTPTNLKHEVFTLKCQQYMYRIISYVYNKRKQLRVLSEQ